MTNGWRTALMHLGILAVGLAVAAHFCAAAGATQGEGKLRLALVSMKCLKGDVQANVRSHEQWVERAVAAGAQFIGFPECSLTGYSYDREPGIARDSAPIQRLTELARRHNVWIVAGFIEAAGKVRYNTCVLVGPEGVARFTRKLNLAGKENRALARGDSFPIYDLGTCKLGIAICSDTTYYETARVLALSGAELILAPHATYLAGTPESWLNWRKGLWNRFASDSLVVMAGVNNAGLSETPAPKEENVRFAGGALVMDERGDVSAESKLDRNTETMLVAEVDVTRVRKARRESPFYGCFRADLFYEKLVAK